MNEAKIKNLKLNKSSKFKKATMTAKQAAAYIGISYWLILELVKRGEIPCIDLGRRKLFRKKSLDDWMTKVEEECMEKEIDNEIETIEQEYLRMIGRAEY